MDAEAASITNKFPVDTSAFNFWHVQVPTASMLSTVLQYNFETIRDGAHRGVDARVFVVQPYKAKRKHSVGTVSTSDSHLQKVAHSMLIQYEQPQHLGLERCIH